MIFSGLVETEMGYDDSDYISNNNNKNNHHHNNNTNNSIQFFIIYVPSQQPQGQLQTQHSVGTRAQCRYNNTIQYNNSNNNNTIIK
jgi:hypothetical protein